VSADAVPMLLAVDVGNTNTVLGVFTGTQRMVWDHNSTD
jgi:hypothetical protein